LKCEPGIGFRSGNRSIGPKKHTLSICDPPGDRPSQTSNVAKVNPTTLKVQELIRHPSIDGFGVTTVAIQVANELWFGSVRGDRIAIFPLTQSPIAR